MPRLPSHVFHYTSNAGLMGIIASRTVWASDIRYLNDAKDYAYAFEIFAEVFDNALSRWSITRRPFLLDAREQLARIEGWQTFVASFSEVDDLLSQWRGYCPSGQGVSVGLDAAFLRVLGRRHAFA